MKHLFSLFSGARKVFMGGVSAVCMSIISLNASAQSLTIRGAVSEASTGEPLAGASIVVKGTTTGTVAADGTYTIKAHEGDVLECQFFGFKTQEVTVGKSTVINFSLEEDSTVLEDAVVVGYGTLKKTQLVGSVENLSGDAIEDRPNANVARSLQGQVAGLNIIQTDGKASHTGKIYIRGNATTYYSRINFNSNGKAEKHSLGNGGSALVLIDGVEGDLTSLNPNDIETVAVLKDASSASIYGARAAYGVILVTTKNADSDKVTVTYNGSYSYNTRVVKWEDNIVTDGLEWTEAFYEFYNGNYITPTGGATLPSTINTFKAGSDYLERFRARRAYETENGVNLGVYNETDGSLYGGNAYSYYGSTNWLKEFYKRGNSSTTHDLTVRGSSKKIQYSLSARYFTQEGIYKIGNDDYFTVNLRSKVKVNINKWLSFDNNTALFRSKQSQSMFTTGSILGHQIDQHGSPALVPVNEDGTYTLAGAKTGYASFIEGNSGQDDSKMNITTTTGVTLNLIKDVLKIRGDFSYKAIRNVRERYRAPLTFYLSPTAYTEYVQQAKSYKSRWNYDTDYITANAVATWTPKFGEKHDLNVVAGWSIEDYNYNRFYVQRLGMIYPDMHGSYEIFDDGDNIAENSPSFTQDDSSYGIVGVFGRANYSFMKRYIIEAALRYDGSSKFPSSQRWGLFPSFSGGWRLSEEPFMKWSKPVLDNLKIRANYGSLGNGSISAYSFLETMGISKTSVLINGTKPAYTTLPSNVPESLTWETITTYDIGLDADLLRSRLSFSGDLYIRNTTDLITESAELPAVYGTDPPDGNSAAIQTKGWEATLSWRDAFNIAGKAFTYNIKGSIWDSRTWVTKYNNTTNLCLGYYEGKELGEIWGFRTDGYFLSNEEANNWSTDTYHKNGNNFREYAGDLKFVDMDGDGTIGYGSQTVEDHGDLDRIGNVTPRFQYGLNLDFKWNGIGLSLFFQGVGKRDWYPDVETAFFYGGYNRPYSGYLMKNMTGDNYVQIDYYNEDGSINPNWTVTNADKKPYWTRRVGYSANRNVGPLTVENDYYLQNAAYIRLKNLTVDYTLPEKLVKKVGVSGCRVYCSMENLWTWSPMFKHTKMFDPEVIGTGDSDFDSASSTSSYGLSGVGEGYSYPMLKTFTFGLSLTF